MAHIPKQFPAAGWRGGSPASSVLCWQGRQWLTDGLSSTPPHITLWAGVEMNDFSNICVLLWSWHSEMQGCKWNAHGVIACCVKWWEAFFFLLSLWLTGGLLYNAAHEHGLFFDNMFLFLFISHTAMTELFYACVFAPFFYRTLMSLSVDGSDGEWDVDTTLEHPSLSPSRWPFRLKTLQRGWYCGSLLHLHHRSVTNCKRKKKSYYCRSPGSKWHLGLYKSLNSVS